MVLQNIQSICDDFVYGYHLSKHDIKIGEFITSNTHVNNYFNELYQIYKDVATRNNLYFPSRYGYAYPFDKNIEGYKKYLVRAEKKCVTYCDYNHSLQLLLENSFFSPISLHYALESREAALNNAEQYFNFNNANEIISDKFQVIKIL